MIWSPYICEQMISLHNDLKTLIQFMEERKKELLEINWNIFNLLNYMKMTFDWLVQRIKWYGV